MSDAVDRSSAHAELERALAAGKRGKPFVRPWLDIAALPPLLAIGGGRFSTLALQHCFAEQHKGKALAPAPALQPWLAVVERQASGDFATALLQQWLASEQEAADRWSLGIAGALGDDRVVDVLVPWIAKWCDQARHKLAEYAAQSIALVGNDHALMVLDALRTRYRSKFRNVGAAAGNAFESAAAARGLTPDELGDRLLPTLGFDATGGQEFAWPGGGVRCELGSDGKLRFVALDGERTWKSLPATAPPSVAAAVKELADALRQARKAQDPRLEQALVRQRRWAKDRFAELFFTHPFGRVYAGWLVCGVFSPDGHLLRCCRRYPNGIVADADGHVDELADHDVVLGFVHPLDLNEGQLATWRAHLQRARVVPPFAQLDRPTVRLEPGQHNRREIALAHGKQLAAGTFRGRAERRGWLRGSVADAGGVTSYWKDFPGAGFEVVLEVEDMYIGIDPMAQVTLGHARFVRTGSVRRGSYVYDDPQGDDVRVVTFGQVPPVVWSETIGDLRAILGEETPA